MKSLSEEGTQTLVKTIRCSSCGAPLTPSAESILTICSFCGAITAQSPVDPHLIVKPLPLRAPEGPGQVKKMELVLVPFFEVKASVDVNALGYQRRERTETKTVRRGGKTYTETKTIVEYRPWQIQHHGNHAVRFLARQEFTMFGAGEMIASVASNIGGETVPFSAAFIKSLANQVSGEKLEALSPEWGQDEASKKAGEMVYEAAYSRAKSEMHEVFDTQVRFKPLGTPMLIHEPLLLLRRQIQGRMYRSAYHWGNGQLLREEQPIKNRRLMVIISLLSLLLAPVFAQLAYSFSEAETWIMVVFGILGVGAIVAAIVLLVRSYKPHKIKSSGSGISLFSFQRISGEEIPQQKPQQKPAAARKRPKFCPKCGDPLEPGQQFCEKCGHRME